MDEFVIHNVRFYDYEPRAIQCMSYEEESYRLALSRSDGAIEIWNCQNRPFLQLVLPAESDASVEGLAWCDGRLFSVGLHGYLIEYDLSAVGVKARYAVTGGPTWCLALSPDKKSLAMGTEEGYVCLFDVGSDDVLYNKTLEKQEGRILSICWHNGGNHIVTGSINCVRLWSLMDGRVTRCSFVHNKREEIIVWCVAILDDMTIISGDSRGSVCFWNGTLGTQTDYVQSHKAGVLCLAVGSDQSFVIVAGVDPTIIRVSLAQTGGKKGRRARWIPTVKLRVHTHDVRALAFTNEGKLYSGGVDTILACSSYPPKVVIKTPTPLYPGYVSLGRQSDCVLLRYKERLELWRLGKPRVTGEPQEMFHAIEEDRQKLVELHCKEGESIDWCALSPEGFWIAYIVKGHLKILQFFPPTLDRQVSIRRVRALSKEIDTSRQVMWLGEEQLVSVTTKGTIQFITISDMEATVESTLTPRSPVQSLASSQDGKVLVVLDVNQGVTAYKLESGQEITLPKYSSPVVSLCVNPFTYDVLIAYSDSTIKEYSLRTKKYTNFSTNFLPSKRVHNGLSQLVSAVRYMSYDLNNGTLIFLHDDSSLLVLDSAAVTEYDDRYMPPNKITRGNNKSNKQNISGSKSPTRNSNIGRLIAFPRLHQVLFFSHIRDKNIISVEIDPVALHDQLPPMLKVKKYGGV
ncbi:U3 small nucleolar RNA-associated protein 4 [Halocaridina rubra]|uniref:U3 small nucleolar RNA-associated protein 4 n=1 Tax=Halocaridina rubra TaxID=373956 RepID=A0AAN9AD96_HALRR